MKKMLALIIALVMMSVATTALAEDTAETTPAPVEEKIEEIIEATIEATAEAPAEAPAREIIGETPIAEETAEPTVEPEITEDDQLVSVIEDAKNENRCVSIYASFSGDCIHYGDRVTLKAKLSGYDDVSCTLQWQFSKDNSSWQDVSGENGTEYSFTVTEDNASYYYRIAVSVEE